MREREGENRKEIMKKKLRDERRKDGKMKLKKKGMKQAEKKEERISKG